MSRGLPSMTALLGLLAIAGYQNRDKLAEMLSGAGANKANPGGGAPESPLGGLLGNLGGMLGGAGVGGLLNGGIGELLEKFKQNGEGETAESWVNNGPNKEVAPPQLKQAIGTDVLAALEQQTGLSQEEIAGKAFPRDYRLPLTSTRPAVACRAPELMAACRNLLSEQGNNSDEHTLDHYHRLRGRRDRQVPHARRQRTVRLHSHHNSRASSEPSWRHISGRRWDGMVPTKARA